MNYKIRPAKENEFKNIGNLLVRTYSNLDGFPTPTDQPKYYNKLQNIHLLLTDESIELLVAVSDNDEILGTVLFFSDLKYYGSRDNTNNIKNAAGFRFLAVDPNSQGIGIGKGLVLTCIQKAKEIGLEKVVIHSTEAMKTAWKLYLKLGFIRTPKIDFSWDGYGVYGFKLKLKSSY